jgi:hypothetical protein
MGYARAMSPCICCKQSFTYNPMRVPSTSAVTGVREPIYQACSIDRVNRIRVKNGLPPIVPLPDAYEVRDESEAS